MSTKGTKRTLIIGGALVFVAAFAYLLTGGIGDNLVYFLTPSELVAKGTAAYDTPLRLGGQVVPGSVQWDAATVDLKFMMQDGKAQVMVHSHGAPPQMFRDGIGVVVEGRYSSKGMFEATNLLVKHSNEYKPPKPGQEKPAELYKSLMKGGR
jgi:cytochrome c-type biogenesis protein CcmE